ncbi:hypothetical protein ACLE50_02925 [Pseudonocardia sp. 1LY6.1]
MADVRARFVRYESPVEDAKGRHVGVFGLVNVLGRADRLSPEDHRFWRSHNEWYDATLDCPAPEAYDELVNPLAAAWFKATATQFLEPVPGCLAILRRHGVECVERWSDDPGRTVYEDRHQVVVVPRADRET